MDKSLITVCPHWIQFNNDVIVPKNTTYIFKANISEYFVKIADKYAHTLSSEELDKTSRFANKSDSDRYISGRYLLRQVLSSLLDISPENVQLNYSKHQKPYSEGIEFNLSHSGNYGILALSHFAVGVDIELIKEGFNYDSLSSTIFSIDEATFIENSQYKLRDFFTMWTRKEAILKATGEGLVDDMKNVNCLEHITVRNEHTYELSSILIEKDYVASIAINNVNENEICYVEI